MADDNMTGSFPKMNSKPSEAKVPYADTHTHILFPPSNSNLNQDAIQNVLDSCKYSQWQF